jgi:hypothetical protein
VRRSKLDAQPVKWVWRIDFGLGKHSERQRFEGFGSVILSSIRLIEEMGL